MVRMTDSVLVNMQENSDWLNDEEAECSQRQDESRLGDADNDGEDSTDWDEEAEDEDELDNDGESTTYLEPSWLRVPQSSVIWIVQEDDKQNSILDSHHGSCLNMFFTSWQSLLQVLCVSIVEVNYCRLSLCCWF